MPGVWPNYQYKLHHFTAKKDEIAIELEKLKITYRSIVSITYIGHSLYTVFYGLKEY